MRLIICCVLYVLSTSVIFSQKLNDEQIKYAIDSVYRNMNEFHLTVYTKTDAEEQEPISFTYDLYKKQNEFYIRYTNMEVIFNSSIVLMVIPDQKVFVIRPLAEKESKKMQEMIFPVVNTSLLDIAKTHFFETDKFYITSLLNPTEEIAEMKFHYNKTTFLLDKVDYLYNKMDDKKNIKTFITYTYQKISVDVNYFNTDKYIIKTAKGYKTTSAYSSYSISVNDPYEN